MVTVYMLLGLMLFTWGAAIWASFHDEETEEHHTSQGQYPRRAA
jgi:hypothetical protein